jgi:murein DD-endopeptidase MepM/ murein hydrolase activator NlpD
MRRKLFFTLAVVLVALLGETSSYAQTTFSLPVTSDTGGYRKFDSKAVSGKLHTGDDYYNSNLKALATNCGKVVSKIYNGQGDHGFGNTLIIQHALLGGYAYSVYGHLASFAQGTDVGRSVSRGQQIGTIGKTGSGSGGIVHLHFEIKSQPTLSNPTAFGSIAAGTQYGYVPINAGTRTATSATSYGYFKPTAFYGSYYTFCYL